jgi:excisionase family DNA binding protein
VLAIFASNAASSWCSSEDGAAASLVDYGTTRARRRSLRTTILRAIRAGELEAVRLGLKGDYRIAPEELARWLRPTDKEDK